MDDVIYIKNAHCYWRNNGRKALPYWTTPLAGLYYTTVVVPYQGKLAKRRNVQKHDVINELLNEYCGKAPLHKRGLEQLYDIAADRGYLPMMIYVGLKTMICKNYVREKYIPPNNDPLLEVIHNRMYMEDWEFRNIFRRH